MFITPWAVDPSYLLEFLMSTEPCIEEQLYETNKDLDLPAGFSITVPGPALQSNGGEFSTDPRAVMDGAKAGGIQLRYLLFCRLRLFG